MHRFAFHRKAKSRAAISLQGAHLVGNDGVPLRGEITQAKGEIRCQTRSQEAAGISLLWTIQGFGTVQIQTTRLPPSDKPYHLQIELARHRLLCITLKLEEWGLFDYPGMEDTLAEIDAARDLFIQALQRVEDPRAAADLADRSLEKAMWASENMGRFHASVFLNRRRQSAGFSKQFLGLTMPASTSKVGLPRRLGDGFDSVRIPFTWRDIQPEEQRTDYDTADAWVKACAESKLAIRGGPLLNFGVRSVPDWMYIWENDYEAIFDFAREHVRRTVQRYGRQITSWTVASGLHAENVFAFNFEQIMDLTRMAAAITKQHSARAPIILDITQPWGEYYARNPRTIPPLLYADMAVQSGISFDAFGLQFLFGIASPGYHLRDMFQISSMIDRLANLGKPLHITALAVPSANPDGENGGRWHGEWSDETQAEWLAQFCEIALSKPYVESVCMQSLADGISDGLPQGGVLREDLTPKPAFTRLGELRRSLLPETAK